MAEVFHDYITWIDTYGVVRTRRLKEMLVDGGLVVYGSDDDPNNETHKTIVPRHAYMSAVIKQRAVNE